MSSVDDYNAAFPSEVRKRLDDIVDVIRQAAPEAEETLGYGIPSFKVNGKYVVHYGGFKRHVGFYATPDGHAKFDSELSKYPRGKGSVQFPLDQPLPLDLIRRITEYRVKQVMNKEV